MHDPAVVAFEIHRLVTVWHIEPGGHDSGTICKWNDSHWKWHLHHWRIQVQPLLKWRRRLLTRCESCGGRSTKTHPVNVSKQWDIEATPWWKGERGLYHHRCYK